MTKYLSNNYLLINLHKKPSIKSEIVTQILFGESFSIIKKTSEWLKIKIKEDGYKGYIQNKNNYKENKIFTHKVNVLKSQTF